MVINTSEPILDGTTDDNGDPVTDHTMFMASYQQFLDQPSLGATKQFLNHYLNDKKCCSANIPLSTCVALYLGSLQWMGVMKPEAFSMLSCYHLGNLHVMSSMEAARLAPKIGQGVWALCSRCSEGNKNPLAGTNLDGHPHQDVCCFFHVTGTDSRGEGPGHDSLLEQCNDFHNNEELYWMRAMANATFPLQVAEYLD